LSAGKSAGRSLDSDPDRCNAGIADDDVVAADGAAARVAFKPNCLAIQTSLDAHSAEAVASPDSNLRQTYHPIIAAQLVYPQGTTKGSAYHYGCGFNVSASAPAHLPAPSTQCDLTHGINRLFTPASACAERTHLFQIVPDNEGSVMTEFEYLQEQAARAERLARGTLDAVTVERLNAFAAECREKAQLESARENAA
jgi:hypothetical protein